VCVYVRVCASPRIKPPRSPHSLPTTPFTPTTPSKPREEFDADHLAPSLHFEPTLLAAAAAQSAAASASAGASEQEQQHQQHQQQQLALLRQSLEPLQEESSMCLCVMGTGPTAFGPAGSGGAGSGGGGGMFGRSSTTSMFGGKSSSGARRHADGDGSGPEAGGRVREEEEPDVARLLALLLRWGFKRMCRIKRGFPAVLSCIRHTEPHPGVVSPLSRPLIRTTH
jgi:hypothetical protein